MQLKMPIILFYVVQLMYVYGYNEVGCFVCGGYWLMGIWAVKWGQIKQCAVIFVFPATKELN